MSDNKLDQYSDEQLDMVITDLSEERDRLHATAHEFCEERDRREQTKAAQKLAKEIGPHGVAEIVRLHEEAQKAKR